ncbi:MAG: saccharopine dehydrogenase NADP-binding domain-containing protein, partial [Bacteroidales bacterium]|nr:saccharopine dehydrogenase NADP-binding domain-containing protein [Bacteroidales bacterium]
MKKVVVLGTGMVAKPLVEYLLEAGFEVVLASNTIDRAKKILNGHPKGSSLFWEAGDAGTLSNLISGCNLTVSLLPYKFHVEVARVCLEHSKPMVTTSYVNEEMEQLDKQARDRGIILLNETGLDPGIDHMSAMRIIDKVHSEGGKIKEFYSLCGALPAPESNNNPFGYKFSWSPKGVILASRS